MSSYTKGVFGWQSRDAIVADLDALKAQRGPMVDKLAAAIAAGDRSPIRQLLDFARAQGRRLSPTIARPATAPAAAARKGYPNLNDDDWLWGGKLDGDRQHHPPRRPFRRCRARQGAAMPAFGRDGMLKRAEIDNVGEYVRSLAGLPADPKADLAAGKKVFADNCAVCHGDDGKGNRELGAPNLTDAIWLYGADKASDRRRHLERPRRRDAGMGRPARRRHHQGAGGLRAHARRRREMSHVSGLRHRPRAARGASVAAGAARPGERGREDARSRRRRRCDAPNAPEPDDEGPLYVARRKIYPQSVQGTFRTIKWIVLIVTLGIYYLLPFVRWDRGPDAPGQAVLVDFPGRRFYFFFIEIWPQEVYYLTGLLILAAMALFLMNAVAGRVWCGYLCPQTVWTDLFQTIERWFEGDRREHMRRDSEPWTLERVGAQRRSSIFSG